MQKSNDIVYVVLDRDQDHEIYVVAVVDSEEKARDYKTGYWSKQEIK